MAGPLDKHKFSRSRATFENIPLEFDLVASKVGFTMRGWDFSRDEIAEAIQNHHMLNPAIELGTNLCPFNCLFCFTEDPANYSKKRLKNELSLERRLALIDEVASLGAKSINFVGAGEPTIDPHFWRLIDRMVLRDITPIIYTEGTLKLIDEAFSKRLFESNATVVLKVNSIANHEYQNAIVRGIGKNVRAANYTIQRNKVIELLRKIGFADSEPTRLAFDTIITKQNLNEIFEIHRYARKNNIFVLFVNYLPSGRSSDGISDALSRAEQFEIFEEISRIDEDEFGLRHAAKYPYAGGVPCSIRGTGLFVKITGKVFDCPGELIPLGDLATDSLATIWEQAKPITKGFDGGCAPREVFWENHPVPLTQITRKIKSSKTIN